MAECARFTAGVSVPATFPEDFYPVIGMSVLSCVEYYNRTHGPGTWDAADVARRVGAAKEGHYQELTAAGIAAMQGVHAMVKELQSLGVRFAIASSGVECRLCVLLRGSSRDVHYS